MTATFPALSTTLSTSAPLRPPLDVLRDVARHPALPGLVEHHPTERRWHRIETDHDVELWLISWPPGSSTGWHDHGTARGAIATLQGRLTEGSWAGRVFRRRLGPGDARTFPSWHVHDVGNRTREHALSLHAYTPALTAMTRYRVADGRLEVVEVERADTW
jgi:quercetin dioxygenase-like cupin family protein